MTQLHTTEFKTTDTALFVKVKAAIDKAVAEHEPEAQPAKTPAYMRAAPKAEPSFEQGWWQASAGPGDAPSEPVPVDGTKTIAELDQLRAERDQLRAERDQLRVELSDQERLVKYLRAKNNRSYVSGQIGAVHDTINTLQKKSTELLDKLNRMPVAE